MRLGPVSRGRTPGDRGGGPGGCSGGRGSTRGVSPGNEAEGGRSASPASPALAPSRAHCHLSAAALPARRLPTDVPLPPGVVRSAKLRPRVNRKTSRLPSLAQWSPSRFFAVDGSGGGGDASALSLPQCSSLFLSIKPLIPLLSFSLFLSFQISHEIRFFSAERNTLVSFPEPLQLRHPAILKPKIWTSPLHYPV